MCFFCVARRGWHPWPASASRGGSGEWRPSQLRPLFCNSGRAARAANPRPWRARAPRAAPPRALRGWWQAGPGGVAFVARGPQDSGAGVAGGESFPQQSADRAYQMIETVACETGAPAGAPAQRSGRHPVSEPRGPRFDAGWLLL